MPRAQILGIADRHVAVLDLFVVVDVESRDALAKRKRAKSPNMTRLRLLSRKKCFTPPSSAAL